MVLRQHLSHGAARRVPDVVRGLDAEPVHEPEDVARHLLDGVLDPRVRAQPCAAVIVGDDAEVPREVGDLRRPEGPEPRQAGHEEERRAAPPLVVVELGVTDRDARH